MVTGRSSERVTQIEREAYEALKPLIGLPLLHIGRAVDLLWVGFGAERTVADYWGKPKTVGEYALHIQGAWRVVNAERVLIGSWDMFFTPDGEYVSMDDETSVNIKQWNAHIRELLETHTDDVLKVEQIITDQYGGLKLVLNSTLVLEVFSNTSRDHELWRFFRPSTDEDHFVMLASGVEGDDDE